ncbi:uncharacterized protein LOC131590197 isoform X9 [Poecile atricapillus]|uniref:uncharacterized protein LOC131590197 isoform X9 n=1 Tax=Poecile atricapillus TaxID=48891 RepID=UPI00273A07D4|nr:uncharacterized protein LOC131590197 isoform X9 [Poecile atricapillus]
MERVRPEGSGRDRGEAFGGSWSGICGGSAGPGVTPPSPPQRFSLEQRTERLVQRRGRHPVESEGPTNLCGRSQFGGHMTASGICSVCPGGSHVTPRAPRDLHRRRFLSPCGGEGRASGHVTAVRPLSQSGAVLMMPYRRRRCRSHWGHRDPPGMPTWAPPTHVPRGPMERLQNRDCVSRHAPWSLRARQSRDCPQVPSQLLPKCLPEPAAGESLLWHLQLLLTWGAAQGGGTTAVKGTWDQRRHQQSKKHFPSCSSFSTHSTLSMELKTGDQGFTQLLFINFQPWELSTLRQLGLVLKTEPFPSP